VVCPVCGSRATGRVGIDQYYCWDCCVEWTEEGQGRRIYAVDEEGELTLLDLSEGGQGDG
jgi:transposase-like protein